MDGKLEDINDYKNIETYISATAAKVPGELAAELIKVENLPHLHKNRLLLYSFVLIDKNLSNLFFLYYGDSNLLFTVFLLLVYYISILSTLFFHWFPSLTIIIGRCQLPRIFGWIRFIPDIDCFETQRILRICFWKESSSIGLIDRFSRFHPMVMSFTF